MSTTKPKKVPNQWDTGKRPKGPLRDEGQEPDSRHSQPDRWKRPS